ncbi:MAG TPA: glutathione synthase [Parvibaculum sp.]|uniref:glutathione synthase n=1 Tax=Parvibaculum sp. TaxID=2024848 RepID=UPI002CEA5E57|nr:glutathione synthase [Parvibaculum sp.]HMM14075.1 glutathione synthase [Parvibaculum sp.]
MSLKVAIQMDPIHTININADSTFALGLEAQARGHELYYYEPRELSMRDGRVYAHGRSMTLRREIGNHSTLGSLEKLELEKFDVVLMRQDPPFDMGYITVTHMLETIHPRTLVVNDPAEVRNAPEKLFAIRFEGLLPPTLISRDPQEIRAFRREFGDIIVKPLFGNGGMGVFRLREGDENLNSLLEMFGQMNREPVIVQQYLPDVRKGDKRIILVDGKPVGAVNRVPAADEARSNLHVGGMAEKTVLTKREHEICEIIGPDLRKRGLIFVGIDVIGDYLTEINVTSPTGIQEIDRFDQTNIAATVWDAIEARR